MLLCICTVFVSVVVRLFSLLVHLLLTSSRSSPPRGLATFLGAAHGIAASIASRGGKSLRDGAIPHSTTASKDELVVGNFLCHARLKLVGPGGLRIKLNSLATIAIPGIVEAILASLVSSINDEATRDFELELLIYQCICK
jgi:hypothetical protein